MQTVTLLLAGLSGLALTDASPLFARNVCGSAPSGPTGAKPLAQPTGITTPADCQTAAKAESGCESFVCGYVNSAPVCMLYGVPASEVPPQSSANLLAYDLACTSVPKETLSASNPTGANTNTNPNTNTNTNPDTNSASSPPTTPAAASPNTGGKTGGKRSPLVARDTCGSAPSGPTGAQPLAQPSGITKPADCQTAAKAQSGCESFVCGYANSAPVCILYGVPASKVPPQSSPDLLVYDLACSSVPDGVLSANNPTGAN